MTASLLSDTRATGALAWGASVGLLAGPARPRAWTLEARWLRLADSQLRDVPTATEQAVSVGLWAAGVVGCYPLASGLVDVSGCAELEAGQLSAHALRLRAARDASLLWMSAGSSLQLAVPVGGGWRVQASGAVLLPWGRQRLAVNETQVFHSVPNLTSRFTAGLQWSAETGK